MVVPEVVSLVDIAPTLLDAVGLKVPADMQGRSMMPLVERKIDDWSNEVLIQVSESMVGRAIRTNRWKYCAAAPEKGGAQDSGSDQYIDYQMYDLFADPYEQVNLVGRNGYKDQCTELRERLKKLMVAAGEPQPEILPARLYP
jgi:arylsulfatase A-like enzyme